MKNADNIKPAKTNKRRQTVKPGPATPSIVRTQSNSVWDEAFQSLKASDVSRAIEAIPDEDKLKHMPSSANLQTVSAEHFTKWLGLRFVGEAIQNPRHCVRNVRLPRERPQSEHDVTRALEALAPFLATTVRSMVRDQAITDQVMQHPAITCRRITAFFKRWIAWRTQMPARFQREDEVLAAEEWLEEFGPAGEKKENFRWQVLQAVDPAMKQEAASKAYKRTIASLRAKGRNNR